jgi:hypothetical protein
MTAGIFERLDALHMIYSGFVKYMPNTLRCFPADENLLITPLDTRTPPPSCQRNMQASSCPSSIICSTVSSIA